MNHRRLFGIVLVVAFVVAAGFLAFERISDAPRVVQPSNLESLDPAVQALVKAKLAQAGEKSADGSIHGDLGLVYEANLLWTEARECFEAASSLQKEEMIWRFRLALSMRQTGDFSGALRLLQLLGAQWPSSPFVQQRLGLALVEAGDLKGAEGAFQKLIDFSPNLPHGYLGLGDVMLQRREPTQAAELLKKAVAMAPEYRSAHYLLGRAYQLLGRSDLSERELALGVDAGISYVPDPLSDKIRQYAVNITARLDVAKNLLGRNEPEQAAQILEETRVFHPSNISLLNNLAVAYLRTGRLEEAEKLLLKARELDARKFLTYVNLTSWAMRANRPEQALNYADAAVERAPTLDQAHFSRGQVLARLGRFEEALNSLERAQQFSPQSSQNYAYSGFLYMKLKSYRDAHNHYLRALELDARSLPAAVGLVRANLALGRSAEAKSALAKAQRIAPDHESVRRLQRQIQVVEKR